MWKLLLHCFQYAVCDQPFFSWVYYVHKHPTLGLQSLGHGREGLAGGKVKWDKRTSCRHVNGDDIEGFAALVQVSSSVLEHNASLLVCLKAKVRATDLDHRRVKVNSNEDAVRIKMT